MESRLDVTLYEKGYYPSREKAKEAIVFGRVKVNGRLATKPSQICHDADTLEALPFEFVSRGGFKLQKALEEFHVDVTGKTVLDIGASTGGFTDVCLKNGAKKVLAVDTGEGQLSASLREDVRVINLEKTNYLNLNTTAFKIDLVVIDVSFVSLTHLIPKLDKDFEKIEIVALIKPQFECGIDYAKKHKGIVKDEKMHKKIVNSIKICFQNHNFSVVGCITSPIKGGDGNTEFLIYVRR